MHASKPKRRAVTVALYQLATSPAFYLAIVGIVLLNFAAMWETLWLEIPADTGFIDFAYVMSYVVNLSYFVYLYVFLASVPYVTSFCGDQNCQYIKPMVVRCGVRRYCVSKILGCALSAYLVIMVGLLLTSGLVLLRYPMFNGYSYDLLTPPFNELAHGPVPMLYFIFQYSCLGMNGALWAVVGLTVSAWLPNRFVALASPLFFYYILTDLLSKWLPAWISPFSLGKGADVLGLPAWPTFLYITGVFIVLIILVGLVFTHLVKRRVRNELV